MEYARIKRFFLGAPLTDAQLHDEKISKFKALAILSSDALSSVAYATEEILIPLSIFAIAAAAWSLPIALAIGFLLLVLTISYRQTISAYPNGGGAYIVAKENIGINAGLVAGAALLIDYVLTVSVSIAAGVENIASAFPYFLAHKELLGVSVITIITVLNLRGISHSASIFALPTYFFIFSMVALVGVGFYNYVTGQIPEEAPLIHETYPAIPIFLLLKAFSSGCSALTGVEAISNGIPLFKEPAQKNAKTTMLWMSLILGFFFLGITCLAHLYNVLPHEHETSLSVLSRKILGSSIGYYCVQASTALILVLAANTSYAGFPLLASLLAKDRFLPRQLASLGDRLVFSNSIIGLSFVAGALLVLFKSDTHLLIPLYAIGVFLSFTLSQAGMVIHHYKGKASGWRKALFFNLIGAITTLIVLLVIGITKFIHGAWIVIFLIPFHVFVFKRIFKHYVDVGKELSTLAAVPNPEALRPMKHIVIIPISGVHKGVLMALRYSISISTDVRACYVDINTEATERMQKEWARWANNIPLVILKSPYRSVTGPLLNYIDDVSHSTSEDMITIVIPEFITKKWWHQFLHNQTAWFIRGALMFKKGKVVTSVRYHLETT